MEGKSSFGDWCQCGNRSKYHQSSGQFRHDCHRFEPTCWCNRSVIFIINLLSWLCRKWFLFDCILQELTKEIDPNSNGKIIPKKCDVTDETELLSIFKWIKETIGHLDVFVNNAGVIKSDFLLGVPHSIYRFFFKWTFSNSIQFDCHFAEGKTEDFKNIFDVNVISACVCIRESVKLLKENDNVGHIIVINR